jgi:colanic acid/amylovoran biosynthesis glycosyltransferase
VKPIVLHLRHHLAYEPFIQDVISRAKAYQPVVLCNDEVAAVPESGPDETYVLGESSYPWKWGWTVTGSWIALSGHLPYCGVLDYARVRVLHAHFGPTGVWALPLRRRLGVPLVTSFYGYDVSQHGRKLLWRLLYQILFRQGDCFLALGPAMRRKLIGLGCPEEKIRIHHLGVDLDQIPFAERSVLANGQAVRILMVGRLVEKKGFAYGIRGFAKLAAQFPQAELRILGDGPLRDELMNLIEEEGLQTRTFLLGNVPRRRVFEEMAWSHLLLAPSVTAVNGDQEGTPTVLLEAQASGLPVVATQHADIPCTVAESQSGFLVPERDVDALAACVAQILSTPSTWSTMGRAGRQHVATHFNIHRQNQILETLYQSAECGEDL